jgi:glycosyltransferase involved in cell wall biosynthesis
MIRLSIIVPVYNVAPYLTRCLDSLLAQGLGPDEYEIILVNDGSTDESGSIARTYAEKYSHIQLIAQQNQGLGGARNTGIARASARYIQFVDPDDFLEPGILIPLLEKMERDELDILRFNYQNVNEQYKVIQPYKYPKYNEDYSDNVTDGITFLTERMGFACYACQFIFKTELIQKEGNQFTTRIYFEDTEWTPRILVQAQRVTSVNKIVYNYLLRTDSITRGIGTEKHRKIIHDSLLCINSIENLSNSIVKKEMKAWGRRMIALLHVSILKYAKRNLPEELPMVISELRKKKHWPLSFRNLPPNHKRNTLIINLSPALFCRLVR